MTDYRRHIGDRNFGCRISDRYTYKGWQLLILENEFLRVSVLPEKGSDIFEFLHKPTDTDFMWHTPQGLSERSASLTTLSQAHGNFDDYYEGGWQEILPSGGCGCEHQGAVYGQHGESWAAKWDVCIEEDQETKVAALFTCNLRKVPLKIEKRLILSSGKPVLEIEETVTNLSERTVDFMWGHHPALGTPFLSEDCVLDVPASRIAVHSFDEDEDRRFERGQTFDWPSMTRRDGRAVDGSKFPKDGERGSDELCFIDMREGWFAVTDTRKKLGFAMEWDIEMFPYLWWWQVFGAGEGSPWFGRCYNCALEPWSSYPLFGLSEAVKHNTHKTLAAHSSIGTSLAAIVYEGHAGVKSVHNCVVEGK